MRDSLPVGETLSASVPGCSVTTPANGLHGDVVDCVHSTVLAAGSGSVTYTLPVAVSPSQPPTNPYTDNATIFATSTSDPNGANDSASDPVNLVTRADLVPTITAPSGSKTAGDPAGFDFTVKVKNAGPSDNTGGYTVTGALPTGLTFVSSASCSGSGTSFTCPDPANSGIPFNQTDTYTVHVRVLASACPGDPNATPACNGTAHASVSVVSNGTTDPTSGNNSAGTSPDVSIITQADLEAQSMTSTASSLFANTAPANATTFTYQFTNNGLSNAQHVVIGLPDHPLASANPTYFKIDNLCRVTGTVTCQHGRLRDGHGHRRGRCGRHRHGRHPCARERGSRAQLTRSIATGSFLVKSTATVASRTTDPGSGANVKNVLSPNVTISTVASPPRNPFGIPGTGNGILT